MSTWTLKVFIGLNVNYHLPPVFLQLFILFSLVLVFLPSNTFSILQWDRFVFFFSANLICLFLLKPQNGKQTNKTLAMAPIGLRVRCKLLNLSNEASKVSFLPPLQPHSPAFFLYIVCGSHADLFTYLDTPCHSL